MKYCVGADIGGTTIKLGIIDEEGALISKWEIPTRKGENGLLFMKDIADEIRKAFAEKDDISMEEDVLGVGIGIPGPVLPDGYVEVCVNLDVKDIYPAKLLSDLLGGMPAKVANDANVAALGEMWQGAGKGHDSIRLCPAPDPLRSGLESASSAARSGAAWTKRVLWAPE